MRPRRRWPSPTGWPCSTSPASPTISPTRSASPTSRRSRGSRQRTRVDNPVDTSAPTLGPTARPVNRSVAGRFGGNAAVSGRPSIASTRDSSVAATTETVSTTRPSRSTVMLSASSSTSRRKWEMRMIVRPDRESERMISCSFSVSGPGSAPPTARPSRSRARRGRARAGSRLAVAQRCGAAHAGMSPAARNRLRRQVARTGDGGRVASRSRRRVAPGRAERSPPRIASARPTAPAQSRNASESFLRGAERDRTPGDEEPAVEPASAPAAIIFRASTFPPRSRRPVRAPTRRRQRDDDRQDEAPEALGDVLELDLRFAVR